MAWLGISLWLKQEGQKIQINHAQHHGQGSSSQTGKLISASPCVFGTKDIASCPWLWRGHVCFSTPIPPFFFFQTLKPLISQGRGDVIRSFSLLKCDKTFRGLHFLIWYVRGLDLKTFQVYFWFKNASYME